MIRNIIQSYILKLQDLKDEMENDFLEKDHWTRTESLEIRVALGYIRAAINALYLTGEEQP